MKPLIGIPSSSDCETPGGTATAYMLRRTYVECVRRAGGAVVVIPPCRDEELLRATYASLAGLLLAGGGDIEPHHYGRPVEARNTYVDPDRDHAELLLTRWALGDDLPVLAICRGIQMLNVALGGTLIQDIPSQAPSTVVHHPGPGAVRSEPRHAVAVEAGSRLAAILGRVQADVNSFHHQAVDGVAPALTVVARAPDAIVEALECSERRFVLGVQWHPEEMASTDPIQRAPFTAFVEACTTRRGG